VGGLGSWGVVVNHVKSCFRTDIHPPYFWRGRERFMDAMVDIYAHASIGGLNVVIGEKSKGH